MSKTLDVTVKPEVSYCIELWRRDLQIKAAIERIKDRIEPSYETRPERIAVVCFGPSLNDTWEQVRDFPVILSCSGAHKFLLERGIVPTIHIEVDPRAHKATLMGPPDPRVEYLIASTCHRAVFDHLEGQRVKLWHVFDSAAEGVRTLPHGEWAMTGGCNVGLRALTIAAFLGFRDLHVFGMDGCEGPSGKHAAAHPNQPKGAQDCEYPPGSGIIYRTTPAMLAAAQQTWHELNQMPGVTATFYGEGLVQAMAKDYLPKKAEATNMLALAFRKDPVITPEYAELNARLHRDNLAYGVGGGRHAKVILDLAVKLNSQSILDYGCGKGALAKAIPFPIWEYDPAIPGKQESPRPADLVACTDVLEHVEPERLMAVLQDLRRVTKQIGYLVIHTGPSGKTLADGRNTHLLQHDKAWWKATLAKFFTIGKVFTKGPELHVIVAPLKHPSKSKIKTSAAVAATALGVAAHPHLT